MREERREVDGCSLYDLTQTFSVGLTCSFVV
jgi:hypothetical protein